MLGPLCQLPQQPGIHRTKQQLSFFRAFLSTLYMIQYPADFACGEIRIQKQTGFLTNHFLQSFLLQLLAIGVRLPGLPDDRKINRLTAFLIPDNRRLPLIGNADGSYLCILYTGFCQYLKHNTNRACPYVVCILFHPAGVRIIIFQLLLCYSHNIAGFIKQNGTGTCRPLIDRHNIGCHISLLLRYFPTLYHRMIAVYTAFPDSIISFCNHIINASFLSQIPTNQQLHTQKKLPTALLAVCKRRASICSPVESFPSDYPASSHAVPSACSQTAKPPAEG